MKQTINNSFFIPRFACQLLTIVTLSLLVTVFATAADNDLGAGMDYDSSLKLTARVDYLDTVAREPMIAVHPNGTLFVTGFGSQVTGTDWTTPPPLWRSVDDGKTWASVNVGSSEDGAQGNSDVDLTIGPDGTIYLIALGFNRAIRAGTHISIGVSHDVGSSWTWHRLSTTKFDDRPWVRVTPDGTAHAIWNDGKGIVYSLSHDSGRSWTRQPRIHPIGGSSHMAVGPGGEIAVRISALSANANQFDLGADSIAVSRDNGKSWQKHGIPGNAEWGETRDPKKIRRWVEPLAWDTDNRLYYLWTEGDSVHLGRSDDFGATWQNKEISREPGMAFFGYMVVGEDDRLAATWFVQDGESLSARVALISPGQGTEALEVELAAPFTPLSWNEDKENRTPTTAGEYLPVAFLPDGDVAVVSPILDIHNDRWGFTFWRFEDQQPQSAD